MQKDTPHHHNMKFFLLQILFSMCDVPKMDGID